MAEWWYPVDAELVRPFVRNEVTVAIRRGRKYFRSDTYVDQVDRLNTAWFIVAVHLGREVIGMAGKNKEKYAKWRGFVDIPITGEIVEAFRDADYGEEELIEKATNLMLDGYKVSFAFDSNNMVWTCSLTCVDGDRAQAGYTMVSRGPSWFEALSFALYKHYDVADGEWPIGARSEDGMYR